MKKIDLNEIPQKVKSQLITKKEAINSIATFICQNYPVFGLQHYDEDFREELILYIIEKGNNILTNYDEKHGNFFNYLYCYITCTVRTLVRTNAKKKVLESVAFNEQVQSFEEKEYQYNNIKYQNIESPEIPYAAVKITPEELKKAFTNIDKDKELLVIAMKCSFYITDDEINKVCKHYNLNKIDLYKAIEYCRTTLLMKSFRKQQLQQRRNAAYYNQKKYEKKIQLLEDSDITENTNLLKKTFIKKKEKYYNNWQSLTSKFKDGYLPIRPTNKTVAAVLGICERQVIYYIRKAEKREKQNRTSKK